MTANKAESRLKSIDLLRGVAALGVMLFHLSGNGILQNNFADTGLRMIYLLPVSFGFAGVYLFFLISGFCIHLRWTKSFASGNKQPDVDFAAFWKRRIRRLYPAYIAALLLYLMIASHTERFHLTGLQIWDVISHLLMIHNLDARTVYSIDGVFWTLAIEEQLYLLYFVLLKLRRRFGWVPTLCLLLAIRIGWFAVCFLIHRVAGIDLPASESALSNWFIWALGAVAVEAHFGILQIPRWAYSLTASVALQIVTAVITYLDVRSDQNGPTHKIFWLSIQVCWGIAFFPLINYTVRSEKNLAVFSPFGWLAGIGLFSYSLYLTHDFVLHFIAQPLLAISACLIFAWLFFLMFEKPFLYSPSIPKLERIRA